MLWFFGKVSKWGKQKGGGALICRELVEGQVLRVSGGNLVAFESSVNFSGKMLDKVRVCVLMFFFYS